MTQALFEYDRRRLTTTFGVLVCDFMIQDRALKFKLMAYPHSALKSTADLLKEAEEGFRPDKAVCPWCSSKGMHRLRHGYRRNVIDWHDGRLAEYSVEITCYVCANPECRRKQAYLPDAIVPYAQYSFLFIMQVLRIYYERQMPVDDVCDKFRITRQMFYRWADRFRDDYAVLLSIHACVARRNVQCLCFQLIFSEMSLSGFCELYFQATGRTPLQMHRVESIIPALPEPEPASVDSESGQAAVLHRVIHQVRSSLEQQTADSPFFHMVIPSRPPSYSDTYGRQ